MAGIMFRCDFSRLNLRTAFSLPHLTEGNMASHHFEIHGVFTPLSCAAFEATLFFPVVKMVCSPKFPSKQ
jgi:hypothetical protein